MIYRWLIAIVLLTSTATNAQSFDHQHRALTELLQQYVTVYHNGQKSAIDYGALAAQPTPLKDYLTNLSSVTATQYQQWSNDQQLAFLINAYNAFTLQLIINNYAKFADGEASSIRDLGGLFSKPWEQAFYTLLGKKRTLDWLEHEKIREDFDEPRIHAALVCAAVSCPKLRAVAYTGDNLDEQLEQQMVTFLSDRDKNGIDAQGLYLSKIFDWYAEDFGDLRRYMSAYQSVLNRGNPQAYQLTAKTPLRFTEYDWSLNALQVVE